MLNGVVYKDTVFVVGDPRGVGCLEQQVAAAILRARASISTSTRARASISTSTRARVMASTRARTRASTSSRAKGSRG